MRTIAILSFFLILLSCSGTKEANPRVFIFTDINIDSGDPDDRQSLVHLFWYADELQIEGVVPDRWSARGYEACSLVVEAYEKDYNAFGFAGSGYPEPGALAGLIARDTADALRLFERAASVGPGQGKGPLYVLVWGNMNRFASVLLEAPELSRNIRLITIGTGPMLEKDIPHMPGNWPRAPRPCQQPNWNGFGRNGIYHDARFSDMWWLEINWTYGGMFTGEEPEEMFHTLSEYGNLGMHMKEVVRNHAWAQYFRVGDTPTVLYLIDRDHDPDDPTSSSWAGTFVKPMPDKRPHYFTDANGPVEWDYADPCVTWQNHMEVCRHAMGTLESRRDEMYRALLEKLDSLYGKGP